MSFFSRKRPTKVRITLAGEHAAPTRPLDPKAQVELVCQAVQKLEQVRHLVGQLPELPVGNRHDLMQQLAATSDSLRSLYFLDAIY